ncbi:MAG: hypothetical protein JNK86_05775, partial [Alphaproteobacteria bacterium]|nr:hypothetical protein [Alphaproteobacteria bacterium]
AWFFVAPIIEEVLTGIRHRQNRLIYAGRSAAASPATGLAKRHEAEQTQLLNLALTGKE